ncbi:MAG TPA: hypothetical protein VN578_09630 [Candidatus Binatia bacterium]|jgi:hypothetical protein|nr:hypothetical protein [Candidatus Binatia bacterium]
MKEQAPSEDSFCRLSRAIIERHRCTYAEALGILEGLRLNLVCDEKIRTSVALQAALLTAVNVGKRSFLGGVSVSMPSEVPCLLPWPAAGSLNGLAVEVGATMAKPPFSPAAHTLYFGGASSPVEDGLTVLCSGWRGGVAPAEQAVSVDSPQDFALGGVLAGALGVAKGFLRVTGLSSRFVEGPQGVSLWRPDLDWLSAEAAGPRLELLPLKLWLLGLGHLGQAYLWNLGLLPYPRSRPATVFLQDFDRVVAANWNAGLLCGEGSPGQYKTRLCGSWLEARGFGTRIVERPFDELTKRSGEEPFIALCGFDNVKSRSLLEGAGFDLVVECGLGGTTENFDDVVLHTFPGSSQKASEIWGEGAGGTGPARGGALAKAFGDLEDCGILLATLEGKAISSSFVGAYAGALVVGELLRGLHAGVRCELIKAHLRGNDPHGVVLLEEVYQNRFARSGYIEIQ